MFKTRNTLSLRDNIVEVQEITFASYKNLLKLLFRSGENVFFYENICALIKQHTNLTNEQTKQLDCIEFLLILIEIRILSLGSTLTLHVKDEEHEKTRKKDEDDGEKYITITKNLYTLQQDLIEFKKNCTKIINSLQICLKLPTFLQLSENLHVYQFIDWLEVNKNRLIFQKTQEKHFFESLPAGLTEQISQVVNESVKEFEKISLIDTKHENQTVKIQFSLSFSFFEYVIKMIFGDDLLTLHQNLFKLSQIAHIDLNYIDSCAPGEALLYMKILQSEIEHANKLNQT